MKRFPAILRRYGILVALVFSLGSAWLTSVFADDYFFVNFPALSRTFMVGQSDGMIGLSSQSRSCTVDFICSYPVFGSPSSSVSLWRNPNGRPRLEIPPPVSWESYPGIRWSFSVSHWLLGAGLFSAWAAWFAWRWRRMKRSSLELAALPQ